MKKQIHVSYWLLGQGMQHTICTFKDGDNIWFTVLQQIENEVKDGGYTLHNISQIQIGDIIVDEER